VRCSSSFCEVVTWHCAPAARSDRQSSNPITARLIGDMHLVALPQQALHPRQELTRRDGPIRPGRSVIILGRHHIHGAVDIPKA
jgi:hypothetical protein